MQQKVEPLYKKLMLKFEKRGDFCYAANIAEMCGMTYKAIELFEKANCFDKAAIVAENSELIDKALEDYENAGNYNAALNLAQTAGKKEKAKIYKKLIANLSITK
jgi:tetratricopeptide (TPR) repeat protein